MNFQDSFLKDVPVSVICVLMGFGLGSIIFVVMIISRGVFERILRWRRHAMIKKRVARAHGEFIASLSGMTNVELFAQLSLIESPDLRREILKIINERMNVHQGGLNGQV